MSKSKDTLLSWKQQTSTRCCQDSLPILPPPAHRTLHSDGPRPASGRSSRKRPSGADKRAEPGTGLAVQRAVRPATASLTHGFSRRTGPTAPLWAGSPMSPAQACALKGSPQRGGSGPSASVSPWPAFTPLETLERSRLCVHSGRPCASVWPVCTSVSISAKCD